MESWQKRVIREKKQLDERLEKLTTFINSMTAIKKTSPDHLLLTRQQNLMREYSDILDARIAKFK